MSAKKVVETPIVKVEEPVKTRKMPPPEFKKLTLEEKKELNEE